MKETEYGELYARLNRRVLRFVIGILGAAAEAEDCSQDVWVSVWSQWETFEGRNGATRATWVFVIAKFAAFGYRARRRDHLPIEDVDAAAADWSGALETALDVARILRSVSAADRRVLRERFGLLDAPIPERRDWRVWDARNRALRKAAAVAVLRPRNGADHLAAA